MSMSLDFIDLKTLEEGNRVIGNVYVKEYTKKVDFTSKAPLYGVLHYKGYEMPFKVWNSALQQFLNGLSFSTFVMEVEAGVTKYKDRLELQVDSILNVYENGYAESVFKSLDLEDLKARFGKFVIDNISNDYKEILERIFGEDNLWSRYLRAWCASKMHDACVGGLINHSLKMLNIAKTVVENDSRWVEKKDLIYTGIILHDLGKVLEIENGVYTDISFVTHRVLGVEMVSKHKDFIVSKIGEENYYHLLAIISQHHDEYGERAITVYSRLIHFIDVLESYATGVMDKIENGQYQLKDNKVFVVENDRRLRY